MIRLALALTSLVLAGCVHDQFALHGHELDAARGKRLVTWVARDGDAFLYRCRPGEPRVRRWTGHPTAGSLVCIVSPDDSREADRLAAEFLRRNPEASVHVVPADWGRVRRVRQVRRRLKRRASEKHRTEFTDQVEIGMIQWRAQLLPPPWVRTGQGFLAWHVVRLLSPNASLMAWGLPGSPFLCTDSRSARD